MKQLALFAVIASFCAYPIVGYAVPGAAPGSTIAKHCVAAMDARAKKQNHQNLPPVYAHRKALCACLQSRIQKDPAISAADKGRLAKVLKVQATDWQKAQDMVMKLPKPVLKRMRVHGPACHKATMQAAKKT